MLIVADFNVVFSAVLGAGHSSQIFELNAKTHKFQFIAPLLLMIELGKHTERIAAMAKLSIEELQEALQFVSDQIEFISDEEYKSKIEEARQILKWHEKDVAYLALALRFNCKILSGDKTFKELCPDKVKNPREILEELI